MKGVFSAFVTRQDVRQQSVMMDADLFLPVEVGDPSELFWHFGSADVEVEVNLPGIDSASKSASRLTIRIGRERRRMSVTLYDLNGLPLPRGGAWRIEGENILKDGFDLGSFKELFSALNTLASCLYYPSIRHVTPFMPEGAARARYYDINTGKPFIDQWAYAQQGAGKASTEKTDQVVEDIRRIFRYDRLALQADANHRELLVVANGKSCRLSELGTGIAQFILLLGNISFAKPSYILIDEPESNLHPSLQLDFLSAVASRASAGVIFATHNLSLARQAANRLFAFNLGPTGCTMSPYNQTDNLAHIVGELSFGRSDFAPARKLLLVEGQTDVLTLQNLMAAFGKEHDFAIISLGGRSGIHPKPKPEVGHNLALGLEIKAVIDSERTAANGPISGQRLGFQQMCNRLGISCHILERTAIENYFTQRAIDAAFGAGKYAAFGPHGAISARWSKNWHWRIARASLRSETEATDLCIFLASA